MKGNTIKKIGFKILAVFGVLLLQCTSPEKAAQPIDFAKLSWPIFRGDANLSGVAAGDLAASLTLLWSFQTGDAIASSPVVGFGRVFIGSTDGKLYALDAATGDSVWAFDSGDDIEAPPMLFDSTVYIGNLSGDFFALNARSGERQWSFTTDGEIYGSANHAAAPNGIDEWIVVGSYDFKTYCFDAKTGAKQWEYESDNFINGAPATDGKVILFGGCDERLHIVGVADGRKIGEVVAGSYIAGSAAFVDGHAYLGHYGEELLCIDVAKQKTVWRYDDDGDAGSFFSTPAVNKNYVVIGSRDSRVHCVDRKSGEKVWSFKTRDDVDGSPVICGDKVVVGSNDGRLYILDVRSGDMLWSYEIGADVAGSPAVTNGFVFIGADDGRLYAFGENR